MQNAIADRHSLLKTVLAVGALALAASMSACAPAAHASSLNASAVHEGQLSSDAHPTVASSPLALHNVHVQQYEDRTPREAGSTLPAVVTLVEFEADVCDAGLIDGDFAVTIDASGSVVRATIVPNKSLGTCDQPQRQQFHVSTGAAPAGHPISVGNPLIIDVLPPSE